MAPKSPHGDILLVGIFVSRSRVRNNAVSKPALQEAQDFFVPRLVELSMVSQDNLGILYVRLVRLGQSVLRPVLVVTLRGVLASLGPRDSLRASVEHISALPG